MREQCFFNENINQPVFSKSKYHGQNGCDTKSCPLHSPNPSTLFDPKARASRSPRKKLIRTEHATQFGESNDCCAGSNDTKQAASRHSNSPIRPLLWDTIRWSNRWRCALSKKRGVPSSAGNSTQSSFLLTFLQAARYTATWPSQCVCILITTTRTKLGHSAQHTSTAFPRKYKWATRIFPFRKTNSWKKRFAMVCVFSQNY